jgi:hypothetical protein
VLLGGGGSSSCDDKTEAIKPLSAGAVDAGNTVASGRNQIASVKMLLAVRSLCSSRSNHLPATAIFVAIPLAATTAAG